MFFIGHRPRDTISTIITSKASLGIDPVARLSSLETRRLNSSSGHSYNRSRSRNMGYNVDVRAISIARSDRGSTRGTLGSRRTFGSQKSVTPSHDRSSINPNPMTNSNTMSRGVSTGAKRMRKITDVPDQESSEQLSLYMNQNEAKQYNHATKKGNNINRPRPDANMYDNIDDKDKNCIVQ